MERLDSAALSLHKSLRGLRLEGSQYSDNRPLSAVCTSALPPGYAPAAGGASGTTNPNLVATGGWSGSVRLWDGNSPTLENLATKERGHEDRITGIAMRPLSGGQSGGGGTMIATASIDLTAKLWSVRRNDEAPIRGENDAMEEDEIAKAEIPDQYTIEEVAHLRGHEARLCSVAFHPTGRYVATTSFDHTWRLWDVATGTQLLLQDGHARETYGVGMHPDGSLCSTTDFGGIVRVWDFRTGKSVAHFTGHAKRVLCAEFSPNGFHLATAGDDGTVKVWDLRRKRRLASVPAHSRVVTQLRFAQDSSGQNGEFLMSSSFDGTVKLWGARDWRMLAELRGHEGKVMGADLLDGPKGPGLVSCGYDKTLKLWR